MGDEGGRTDLVVCSLEPWDAVWRRNQWLVHELLAAGAVDRVLFVEPPISAVGTLRARELPRPGPLRAVAEGVQAFAPLRPASGQAAGAGDVAVAAQVWRAARRLGMRDPVLWVNDMTFDRLRSATGWASLYDITDDWLLAEAPDHVARRSRALDASLVASSDEVVVCSAALQVSRSSDRTIRLVPNAVDVARFQSPTARPLDLPEGRTAVYVGTLHDERVDVPLLVELASSPDLELVLVGPSSLTAASTAALAAAGARLLGPRPHDQVPGYLQHADVVVIPHLVTPFTESLDPIKAYECLAVGTPTVATPVPGFRDAGGCVSVATRGAFVAEVVRRVGEAPTPSTDVATWADRAAQMAGIIGAARAAASGRTRPWPLWTPQRLVGAASRRARLAYARRRWAGVTFGDGCDIGRGARFLVGPSGSIILGERCVVDRGLTIEAHGDVTIGDRVIIGHSATIGAVDRITIGDDCLIGEQVSIRDHDHQVRGDATIREGGHVAAPVSIGEGAWVSGKVTVLKGVTIGERAVVGAASVVTRDVPAGATAVGAPARVLER